MPLLVLTIAKGLLHKFQEEGGIECVSNRYRTLLTKGFFFYFAREMLGKGWTIVITIQKSNRFLANYAGRKVYTFKLTVATRGRVMKSDCADFASICFDVFLLSLLCVHTSP